MEDLDDEVLAELSDRLVGRRCALKGVLVGLVAGMGYSEREVVFSWPLKEVTEALAERAETVRCADCGMWCRAADTNEDDGESFCLGCRPDLQRHEQDATARLLREIEEDDPRPLDPDLCDFFSHDDDKDVPSADSSLTPLEDP